MLLNVRTLQTRLGTCLRARPGSFTVGNETANALLLLLQLHIAGATQIIEQRTLDVSVSVDGFAPSTLKAD